MNIQPYSPPSLTEWKGWEPQMSPDHIIVEPKYDGVRAIVHCHPEEGIVIHTRRVNKDGQFSRLEGKLPHLAQHPFLLKMAAQGYTVLDGELTAQVERDCLNSTMTVVGASPEQAIRRQQQIGPLRLTIFDAPWWQGVRIADAPLTERKDFVGQVPRSSVLWPMESYTEPNPAIRQTMLDRYLREGYEGAVFKRPDSRYFDGGAWIKRKERTTVDALVTGWLQGGGKYANTIGSVICSVIDGQNRELRGICSVSPGTDRQRNDLYARLAPLTREEIAALGIVAELEAQGWTVGGGLRHPRVLRYREDRNTPNVVCFDGSRSRVV